MIQLKLEFFSGICAWRSFTGGGLGSLSRAVGKPDSQQAQHVSLHGPLEACMAVHECARMCGGTRVCAHVCVPTYIVCVLCSCVHMCPFEDVAPCVGHKEGSTPMCRLRPVPVLPALRLHSLRERLGVLGPGLMGLLPGEAEQGSLGRALLGYELAACLPVCGAPWYLPAGPLRQHWSTSQLCLRGH